jgi:hypothetical protein
MRVPHEIMEKEFLALTETEGNADIEELNTILDRAINFKNFLKGKERVKKVAQYVADHYRENVEPLGYKAFLVGVDREACAFYKEALDKILPPHYSEIVYTGSNNDPAHLKKWHLDTTREKQIRKSFPKLGEWPKILIVTDDTEKLAFPVYARRLGLDLDREGATIIEVGGKRNLTEFALIAISFGIPTGIVYDEDSSDFTAAQKKDEEDYNATLDALAKADGSVKVWRFSARYEDHLKKALGEEVYQNLCQKFPNTGKPTRARLIAMEEKIAIPNPVEAVLNWLAGRPPAA